jgi:protein TonB
LLHGALGAAVTIFGSGRWLGGTSHAQPPVMTITLGGGGGPRAGGMTAIGGRPVQTTEPAPTREAVRPPAATTEMTLPRPNARPVKAAPTVNQAPDEARGRTPTRGSEVQAGSAIAETGARGQGFGLSTGGGTGSGSWLDVANFCCPDYIALMIDRITSNWNQRMELAGLVIIKFTILRDGRIVDVSLYRSSGYAALDLNANRAVQVTRQLTPLPAEFPNQTLTVFLTFEYQR